jgi:hypothetical protein
VNPPVKTDLSLCSGPPTRAEGHGKALNASAKPVQRLRSERIFLGSCVAEPGILHLLDRLGIPAGTEVVHIKEAECLGNRHPVCPASQEFNLRGDFAKYRVESHFAKSSVGHWPLGEYGRPTGKRQTLNHSNEVLGIYSE